MTITGHAIQPDGTELRYLISDHALGRGTVLPDGAQLTAASDGALARLVQRHVDPEGRAPAPWTGQPLQYDLLQALDH